MIWIIIVGMALVTFIPRILPVFVMDAISFPSWLKKWLKAIPYAALGALIFPSIMTTIPNKPWIGLVAGIAAIILAWLRVHIILVVLSAIGVVYFLQYFF